MCAVQETWVMRISYGTCAESHVDGWRWGENEEKNAAKGKHFWASKNQSPLQVLLHFWSNITPTLYLTSIPLTAFSTMHPAACQITPMTCWHRWPASLAMALGSQVSPDSWWKGPMEEIVVYGIINRGQEAFGFQLFTQEQHRTTTKVESDISVFKLCREVVLVVKI